MISTSHTFYVLMNFHKHLPKYNIFCYVAEMDFLKELPKMIEVNAVISTLMWK